MEQFRSANIIKKLSLLLVLVTGLMLCACTSNAVDPDANLAASDALPSASPARECKVEFYARGELIVGMRLEEWSRLSCPVAPEVEGLRFLYWADEQGKAAEPELQPVREDRVYTAVYAPVLDEHSAYLFVNEAGLLRPSAALDNMELVAALNALASDDARANFPELPQTGGMVSGEALRNCLSAFYTAEELDVAMLSCADKDIVNRSQFVKIMNYLLGRSAKEAVTVSAEQAAIPDVQPGRTNYAELMEAAVPHGHGEGGVAWEELELKPVYEEGFVLIEGWLYYADENGLFVYDTVLGSLTFDYHGRYTSGDGLLDSYVSAVLRDLAFAYTGAEGETLLRGAYEYVRDSFEFLRKNTYNVGAVGWQMPDAISIFECGQGNCYGYAAAFWALARGLGYEAEAFSGAIGRDMEPHAWVEIEIDGTVYIFDPDTEAQLIREGDTVRDMFMLHPDLALNWLYIKE